MKRLRRVYPVAAVKRDLGKHRPQILRIDEESWGIVAGKRLVYVGGTRLDAETMMRKLARSGVQLSGNSGLTDWKGRHRFSGKLPRRRAVKRNPADASAWRVVVDGRDSGIVETNYAYAVKHWRERAMQTGKKITLVPMKKNPARRGRIKGRAYVSGRKLRVKRSLPHVAPPFATEPYRTRLLVDPRKMKRAFRKSGYRVNPAAKRARFVVYAMTGATTRSWFEQASFLNKSAAMNYARALHKSHPAATVKVEKK